MENGKAPYISRRRFLTSASAVGAGAWIAPPRLFSDVLQLVDTAPGQDGLVQQFRRAAATDPVQVQRLRGRTSLLTGSGCNVVALAGDDAVLLVDTGIVASKVAGAVASISRAPVRQVINTHWHFDHTEGNEWLHARGAVVIAHENTRRHLSVDTRVEDWFHFTFPASPAGALPTTVFTDARTLRENGTRAALQAYTPAHTDSDISVYFAEPDVLCVGDTWWNGVYPFIDYATGGSIGGMIRAAEESLSRAGAETLIVPGHGAPGNRSDLTKFKDMLTAIRDRVAKLKAKRLTVDEVVAAKPSAAFDAAWGGWLIRPDFFVSLVYKGV
jgi:glyoxylase-like metal-dependent hydrolase (beta-lactamase superfamily II)